MRRLVDLMDEFGAALQFPSYFGENWSAFQECLEDLEWLPSGNGRVIAVVDSDDVLCDDDDVELGTLVRSFTRAFKAYSKPINDGEWWDRPALPFHVVLQIDATQDCWLGRQRYLDAGASLVPLKEH